jgi:type I restriction enzyme S subunit
VTWLPLKRFCSAGPQYGLNISSNEYSFDGLRFLRTTDITPEGSITATEDAVFIDPSVSGSEYVLREGDLLFSRSGTLGRCLRYRAEFGPASFAGYLVRFRPSAQVEPRYLAHCAQATFFQQTVAAEAISSTISNFNAERYANIAIPWWPLPQQHAIADFLDRETSRIDALITAKRRMIDTIWTRHAAIVDATIWAKNAPTTPLMHLTPPRRQIMYGIVLPGPDVPEGVPIVKGGDVAANRLSLAELNRTTIEIEASFVRSRLQAGDIIYAIRGGIGDVQLVPVEIQGANITQDVARISPRQGIVPEWLLFALKSRQLFAQVEARITGATIRGVNIWDLKRVRVPVPSESGQREIADRLQGDNCWTNKLGTVLERQINLIVEHRQALITAAVTGELEIPGVAA